VDDEVGGMSKTEGRRGKPLAWGRVIGGGFTAQ
jgi:hypothetical protein